MMRVANDLPDQCSYQTRSGQRCRRRIAEGYDGCSVHAGIEDATAPAAVAVVVNAQGRELKVLLRPEMGQDYLCPDGKVLRVGVDGLFEQVGQVPTVDQCDYKRTSFRGSLQATSRAPRAERPAKVKREEAHKEAPEGDAARKVQSLLHPRST